MHAHSRILPLILVSAALSGCATQKDVGLRPAEAQGPFELRPVENPIPPTPVGVYDISKVTRPPRAILQPAPLYPFALRTHNISGEAVIYFIVKTDGSVGDAAIVRATDIRFGLAALQAILKWRLHPAEVDGHPVNCRLMVPVGFSLNNAE